MLDKKYSAYGLLKQYNDHQMMKENFDGEVADDKYATLWMFIVVLVFFFNLFLLFTNWSFLEPWAQVLALLFFLTTDLRGMLFSIFFIMVGRQCQFRL